MNAVDFLRKYLQTQFTCPIENKNIQSLISHISLLLYKRESKSKHNNVHISWEVSGKGGEMLRTDSPEGLVQLACFRGKLVLLICGAQVLLSHNFPLPILNHCHWMYLINNQTILQNVCEVTWCKDKNPRLGMKDLDCSPSCAAGFLGDPGQATAPHSGPQFFHQ